MDLVALWKQDPVYIYFLFYNLVYICTWQVEWRTRRLYGSRRWNKGARIMLIGSTVNDVMSVSAPDPKILKQEEKEAAAAAKQSLCKLKVTMETEILDIYRPTIMFSVVSVCMSVHRVRRGISVQGPGPSYTSSNLDLTVQGPTPCLQKNSNVFTECAHVKYAYDP